MTLVPRRMIFTVGTALKAPRTRPSFSSGRISGSPPEMRTSRTTAHAFQRQTQLGIAQVRLGPSNPAIAGAVSAIDWALVARQTQYAIRIPVYEPRRDLMSVVAAG